MKHPIHLENRELVGKRLVSPTSVRNCPPIGVQLKEILPVNAHVLEIASGTGQHGHHMCGLRSDIVWQPTDIDAESMDSQAAYALDFPGQMLTPLRIDVTVENWWAELPEINAIFCANMIHIAPWQAAEGLVKGAGVLLKNGGKMCLYGPFLTKEGNAESNLQFDTNLRARNPEWGVRSLDSVKHIFADNGLNLAAMIEMPRNNSLLIFGTDS